MANSVEDVDVQPFNLCTAWRLLKEGMDLIYNQQHVPGRKYKLKELHSIAHKYCSCSFPEPVMASRSPAKLQFELASELINFLRKYVTNLLENEVYLNLMDEDLLTLYTKNWIHYQSRSKVLNCVFNCLNRYWIPTTRQFHGISSIYNMALCVWADRLLKGLHKRVNSAVLKMIEKQRKGEPVHTSLIGGVIECYIKLGKQDPNDNEPNLTIYTMLFENAFLEQTENFYSRESSEILVQTPATEYIKKIAQHLVEEQKRVYLLTTTLESVLNICTNSLINKNLDLLYLELVADKNDDVDRQKVLELVLRIPGLRNELWQLFEAHIALKGQESIESSGESAFNDPKVYVSTILDVHKIYNALGLTNFNNDSGFITALDKACERFINNNAVTKAANSSSKSAELLANFCDLLLKRSSKILLEEELEDALDQVMIVVKYIEDKDVFLNLYSKLLARRLLKKISASDVAEASMISKLRQACGFEYSSKLQRMLQDIGVSKDLNENFMKHSKNINESLDFDFNIQVLSSSLWPLQQTSFKCSLPTELECSLNRFTSFYSDHHSNRKLDLLYNISRGELLANCFNTRYTLLASTFQMAVLLQFNLSTSWSVKQLSESTQIRTESLLKILEILIKYKLLSCDVSLDERKIDVESVIKLNFPFKHKKLRININIPMTTDSSEQKPAEGIQPETTEEDRKLVIQSAIVRIMKMRKQLKHHELVAEVIQQLSSSFKPKVHTIKKCIDILIDKEYLERTDGQNDMYSYIA